jgi:hypothetical protein
MFRKGVEQISLVPFVQTFVPFVVKLFVLTNQKLLHGKNNKRQGAYTPAREYH